MKIADISKVKETFEEIASTVSKTMGAKGQLAILQDEMGRPILTDDGVTVAKEMMSYNNPFNKMVALSMIEAASNTEKKAFDGTTLTLLMINEFYKLGCKWIKHGMHPQVAADKLVYEVKEMLGELKEHKIEPTPMRLKQLAVLTTKIPAIGDLVYEAYLKAGDDMNVLIEHDRKTLQSHIDYTDGMILEDGYFSETLKQMCNVNDKYIAENAHLVLLAEDIFTPQAIKGFFNSIPAENAKDTFIFIIQKGFNPDSLKLLTDVLIQNKMRFMFIFVNDSRPEELFLDIAAKTNGKIQSQELGTLNYTYKDCGLAKSITIEQDKTIIIADGDENEIKNRVDAYQKELVDKEFSLGIVRKNIITRRKANLTRGVTKIMVAVPTVTEYATIRLKLDDAIGAVKCAIKNGLLVGGGKALWIMGEKYPQLKRALRAPLITIIKNAGLKIPRKKILKNSELGLNVKTGRIESFYASGILDSYDSIEKAIQNALSISSQYLRTYKIILTRD